MQLIATPYSERKFINPTGIYAPPMVQNQNYFIRGSSIAYRKNNNDVHIRDDSVNLITAKNIYYFNVHTS